MYFTKEYIFKKNKVVGDVEVFKYRVVAYFKALRLVRVRQTKELDTKHAVFLQMHCFQIVFKCVYLYRNQFDIVPGCYFFTDL